MLENSRKKYFVISEVEKISGISSSKLRYIEKNDPSVKITKIRDRRYYTAEDLDYIISRYGSEQRMLGTKDQSHNQIIARIDVVLSRFREFI